MVAQGAQFDFGFELQPVEFDRPCRGAWRWISAYGPIVLTYYARSKPQ